jgi:hypothetical protein
VASEYAQQLEALARENAVRTPVWTTATLFAAIVGERFHGGVCLQANRIVDPDGL